MTVEGMTYWAIFQWICSRYILQGNYENLVVKSSGLYRFKSPGPSSVSRLDVRLFGWVSSSALWFVLNFVISSRLVGICRSVCSSLFGTYHGALTIVFRALFWKRCKISIFEWETVPQSGMPFVYIGFIIITFLIPKQLSFLLPALSSLHYKERECIRGPRRPFWELDGKKKNIFRQQTASPKCEYKTVSKSSLRLTVLF